jgi:glyoxylase-like metal-dependent hydrolase (beta-lactamase superfamily II)
MEYLIERFPTGPLETNTYIVSNRRDACLVVDPSQGCAEVIARIDEQALRVEGICLTHGHFDHLLGIDEITDRYGTVGVWVHPDERELLKNPEYNGAIMIGSHFAYTEPTNDLREGTMSIGPFTFTVVHVPGHSPGGCALVFDGDCLSGDALFAGSIGRTDFPGGNGALLLRGIREKLFALPDETVLWPGHGGRTTIGREKRMNPFFR